MNILVDEFRRQFPTDQRSDDEITMLLASRDDGSLSQYADFTADVKRIKAYADASSTLTKPSIPQEFSRGFSRGVDSLKESAVGAVALGADIVGAEGVRDAMLTKYLESQQRSATENASAVPLVEGVEDLETGTRFALGKVGELIPQIGEALISGAVGAAIGSSVAPGVGTAAGGAVGVTEGFLARQSAKALLKAGIDKLLAKSTLTAIERNIVKDQLQKVAEKKAITGALHEGTQKLLAEQIKSSAANMGSLGANLLNFYGIGAGTIYGDLGSREGVENEDARNAALVGGLGSAIANAPLPTVILSRYFPGVATETAQKYLVRLAKDASLEIPLGATGEALDELVQIAAEKYADPKRRDTPLDDQDLSRLLNAAVVGAGAGALASPISAIPGGKSDVFGPEIQRYFKDVDANRQRQLVGLATRQESGNLSQDDITALRTLNAQESNFVSAFLGLNEEQRNKLTAEVSALKGGERNDTASKEKRQGQGQEGNVLTTEPAPEPAKETPPPAPAQPKVLSDDQKKQLTDLGYDEKDLGVLRYDEAVSLIALGVESPKLQRQKKFRAKITDDVEETAATAAKKVEVQRAASETKPNPTQAEITAGTYQKGKVNISGMDVEIESPKGEIRQNKEGDKPWSVVMKNHYGQIIGTKGIDGDPLDIYIGDNPSSTRVWVVDQIDPATKKMDEHKILFGFNTPEEALAAYHNGFSDGSGPSRVGGITEMTTDGLKKWSKSPDAQKPLRYKEPAAGPAPQSPTEIPKAPAAGAVAAQAPAAASTPVASPAQPEANQTGPAETDAQLKERTIKERIAAGINPDDIYITVQTEPSIPGFPGYVQVDEFDAKTKTNTFSSNPEQLTVLGMQMPTSEVFKKLPNGKYKLLDAIAKLSEKPAPESIGLVKQKGANGKKGFYNIKSTGVSGSVQIEGDTITLVNLRADKEGAGAGGVFIEKLKGFSELTGRKLKLIAKADSKDLSARLENFYKKHGFVLTNPDTREFEFSKTAVAVNEDAGTENKVIAVTDIDMEKATYGSSKRGKKNVESTVYPSWYRPTGVEAKTALEKILVSDRGTPAGEGKQKTKRVTAILDKETGEVHLVSTYESSPGKTAVTIFNEDVRPKGRGAKKDAKSALLRPILDSPRYEVIGSMRTKELTEFHHQVIPTQQQFEEQFGKPLDAATKEVRAIAAAVEAQQKELANEKKAKPGKKKGDETSKPENIVETHLTEENIQNKVAEPVDEEHTDVEFSEVPKVNLTINEARLIAALPDFSSWSEYAALLRDGKVTMEQTRLLQKIKEKQDNDIIVRLKDHGARKVLEDYDKANEGRTNYAGELGRVEQAAAPKAEAPVRDAGGLGGEKPDRPEGPVAGQQDSAGKPGQEGNEGNEVVDPASGEVEVLPPLDESIALSPNNTISLYQPTTKINRTVSIDSLNKALSAIFNTPTTFDVNDDGFVYAKSEKGSTRIGRWVLHNGERKFSPLPDSGEMFDKVFSLVTDIESKGAPAKLPLKFTDSRSDYNRPGIIEKLDDIETDPESKKSQVIALAKKALTYKVITENQLKELQRISKDRDMGVEDLVSEFRSYLNNDGTDAGAAVLASDVNQTGDTDPSQRQMLDDIVKTAIDSGIDVEVVRSATSQSSGRYDPDQRKLVLSIGAAVGSHDIGLAFHEIGHDVFNQLPVEIRDRLVAAIGKVTDRALGIEGMDDTRIQESNPSNLPTDVLQQERLVQSVAASLMAEGFNPTDARSYASRFAMAIKDFFYKAALTVQSALGFSESPMLARLYFENSVKRFLAGGAGKFSYIDMLGLAKPNIGHQWANWFRSSKQTGERLYGSSVQYDHYPNTSAYGSSFNTGHVLFSMPIVDDHRAYRTVMLEREVAALNSLIDLQRDSSDAINTNEALTSRIKEMGKTPLEWLRKQLRISNPETAKDAVVDRKGIDGAAVEFNADKRVNDFKDESNKDAVLDKSYRDTQSMAYKVDKAIRDLESKLAKIEEDTKTAQEKVVNARNNYADLGAQAVDLNKAVRRMLQEAQKVLDGKGKRSMIRGQLRVLDQTGKFKDYAAIIDALAKGTALSGKNIVDALDLAANTPSIDFTQKADEIRKSMRETGKFNALTAGDKNANAMLATVIAIAKANPRLLAELELRRLKEGRAEIEAKIDEMIAGKSKIKPKRTLTRENSIEDRILAQYAKEARKIKEITKNKDAYANDLATLKLVEPVVLKKLDELTGQIGASLDFTFRDGAEYNPAEPGMTTEQVLKKKDTISLDPNNKPSDPAKVEQQLINMKQFLMERDERYAKGDLTAKDRAYQRVERQYQELAVNFNYDLDSNPADRVGIELYAMPAFARIGDSFATAAAQLFKRAGYHFARVEAFLRNVSDGIYDKDYRIRRELFKLVPLMDDDRLQLFIDSSKIILEENTADLVEMYADHPEKIQRLAYKRVKDEILKTKLAKDVGLDKVIDKFMPQFERLIELEHETGNSIFLGQVLKGIEVLNPITGKYEQGGLKVKDPGIRVMDDEGEMVTGIRRHFKKGWRTFGGRRMNQEFNQMAYAMRQSNWAAFGEKVGESQLAEAYNEDPESAREMLNEFFNNAEHGQVVRDWFVRMLAEQQNPVFDAPALEDGVTTIPADPNLVIEAYNNAPEGDIVAFAENLFDLHGGEGDVGVYVQAVADKLGEYAEQVQSINDRYFPGDGKTNPVNAIRGMTPEALVDSREIDGLPSQWFSFYKFDKPSLHKLSRLIASEVAFGRGQEYLASLMETIAKQVSDARLKLEGERLKVRGVHPTWNEKQIEAEVAKMPDYKKLKQFEDRSPYIRQTVHELSSFFRKDNSPEATLYAGTRIAQTLSRLMVNNPASAIYQMVTLFDPMFRYGVSKQSVKSTLTGIKRHIDESVASLMQSIGIQVGRDDEFNNRFNSLNLQYAERIKRFGDEFRRWDNESAVSHGSRLIEELTSTPINLSGKEAKHVLFRPTGLFDWQTMVADKSLTDGMWHMAGDFVTRGIQFFKANPDKLAPGYKLTEKDLALSGFGSANTFNQLKLDMRNFGLDFDQVVRGAVNRNDGKLFTDEEALRLHSLAMFLVSSQSNIATMTPAAWNNNILRWMIPLLGWAWRRTVDVSGKRLTPEGKLQASAMARGMVGLAAATAGGLAVSALVDRYYEELVDRKRNLRPILSPLGIIEHTARSGSTGFFGEFINGAVNVTTGGDSRIISLDRRVVAMSSFMGIQSALSNLINQREFDYSRVGRPLITSLGGNGMLQYMGMANNFFGLDNVESAVNARINAQNYLRVVGRDLNLSVRGTGGGGTGTSTPMTPYITRMELAAYADDRVGFRQAYIEAIRQAKDQGFDDPVDHVKRAFSAKNPLRVVFQTSPSEKEYQRILVALPEDGREAVGGAVSHFNRYAESIGARGFEGKKEKSTTTANSIAKPMDRIQSFRQALYQ